MVRQIIYSKFHLQLLPLQNLLGCYGTEENIIFSGSSRFKGDAKIAATAAGDGNDTFGVHLRNDGLLTAYKGTTTENSPVALFKSNVGGLASENARINADGSAVFADNNITLAANGSATFKGTYLVLGNIFNSADNNTGTTVYQGFVRAKDHPVLTELTVYGRAISALVLLRLPK